MRLTLPPPSASLAQASRSTDPLTLRVSQAILKAVARQDLADPFAGAHARIQLSLGRALNLDELFAYWASRSAGNPRGDMRYRWELCHRRGVRMPSYADDEKNWIAWRKAEQPSVEREPFEFELRLNTPIVLTENAELLAEAKGRGHVVAAQLLEEALTVMRRDFALHVQGLDPWQDTFALWCLTRRTRTLGLLHPLAVAIATGYAAGVSEEERSLLGVRFPFHRLPLVSASAQLASALLALGLHLPLVGELLEFVAEQQLQGGGWGDASDEADVLTTLVGFDLMARIDPSFDCNRPREALESLLGRGSMWRAIGPDAPWLSAEVLALLVAAEQPFAERFRWPYLAPENRDFKTGLPFFAYFSALSGLFSALPGISRSRVELGFVDLIGFRAFNNTFGQERGDEVLRAFAEELSGLANAAVVRDGGDEFIVIGAPERTGLLQDLEEFRHAWPARFTELFGADVPPVAPRILVGATRGGSLVPAREHLGKRITALKDQSSDATGLLVDDGEIG